MWLIIMTITCVSLLSFSSFAIIKVQLYNLKSFYLNSEKTDKVTGGGRQKRERKTEHRFVSSSSFVILESKKRNFFKNLNREEG